MKLSVGKRILMFFHWLLSLLGVAALVVYLIWPQFITKYYDMLVNAIGTQKVQIIGIALLAVYVILAVVQAYLLLKRKKRRDRGFITVDSSDSGKVRIAIGAIEQMVRQSVGSIDGITEMKIGIENLDDAIGIGVNAAIVSGCHVPTITMNMQRAIRQFVETNCGVAVRTVIINIHSVTNQPDAPKRRRFGKGTPSAPAAPAAYTPEPAPTAYASDSETETFTQPAPAGYQSEPEPKAVETPSYEAPVFETPVFAAPERPSATDGASELAYDFEKPYESEFAKDLAAMKAKEATESEEYADEDAPLDAE